MNSHINARTTPYARTWMLARREAGVPVSEAGLGPRSPHSGGGRRQTVRIPRCSVEKVSSPGWRAAGR